MGNKAIGDTKEMLLKEIDRRVEDKVLESANATLLKKLIRNADNDNEALEIASLGTTYKKTGFHFDVRHEKQSNDISYYRQKSTDS